ncbi:MAG: alanyl-tRNA editing protein [Firmicutes bacterium]|nr:alanyl-tRNA editing protein [Bacillota bacterium]
MKTERLYQKDVYLREALCEAAAVYRTPEEHAAAGLKFREGAMTVELDRTVFFPEGGGQPCDLGTIGGLRVLDVKEDKASGAVYHRVEAGELPEGPLLCVLDWQRRFDHMQMHCGEHIVSGLFRSVYGIENRGFHMGDDYMTIDMAPGEDSEVSEITDEIVRDIEMKANEAVWADLPVSTVYFDTREEANASPVRKKIKFDEDISVVFIGDREAPLDCCACCGTHVSGTGQIGLITILKGENYKGMLRLTMKAGRHAVKDALRDEQIMLRVCRRFSAEAPELEAKMDAAEAKNGLMRKELYDLKKDMLAAEAQKLLAVFAAEPDRRFAVYEYPILSASDLQDLAHLVEKKAPGLAALVSGKSPDAVLVSSGDPACGQLVREYASMYKGKGGGNALQARAIFGSREDLTLFLDLLEKHLRR